MVWLAVDLGVTLGGLVLLAFGIWMRELEVFRGPTRRID